MNINESKYKFDKQRMNKSYICYDPHRLVVRKYKTQNQLVQILKNVPFEKDTYFIIPFPYGKLSE